jgi:acyl dehydratase
VSPELFFEDFEAGQEVELGERTLSKEEIVSFARDWDPQPFHVDEKAAAKGPFGSLAASGWQTGGVWSRMYVDSVLSRAASMGGPGMEDLRFLQPVRPGQRLRGRLLIRDTRPSGTRADRGTIHFEGRLVDDDDVTVFTLRGRAYMRRRAA